MIANAVNSDHPAIVRRPARELDPDSDLGDLPVTVAVGPLPSDAVAARSPPAPPRPSGCGSRLIDGAALSLCGQWRIETGGTALSEVAMGVRTDERSPEGSDGGARRLYGGSQSRR